MGKLLLAQLCLALLWGRPRAARRSNCRVSLFLSFHVSGGFCYEVCKDCRSGFGHGGRGRRDLVRLPSPLPQVLRLRIQLLQRLLELRQRLRSQQVVLCVGWNLKSTAWIASGQLTDRNPTPAKFGRRGVIFCPANSTVLSQLPMSSAKSWRNGDRSNSGSVNKSAKKSRRRFG